MTSAERWSPLVWMTASWMDWRQVLRRGSSWETCWSRRPLQFCEIQPELGIEGSSRRHSDNRDSEQLDLGKPCEKTLFHSGFLTGTTLPRHGNCSALTVMVSSLGHRGQSPFLR